MKTLKPNEHAVAIGKSLSLSIRTLKKNPAIFDTWDDTIWTLMVEKGIVHRDGQITFEFYNGTEITVSAE